MKIKAVRYHDISCGHRVVGHENKCRWLHGHNYRITFHCEADKDCRILDAIGRVIDFGCIKDTLCKWLEDNWDHRFLMWGADPYLETINEGDMPGCGIQPVPFNPTAENMGIYLLEEVGPTMLLGTGVQLVKVIVEETRKCSAEVELCDLENDSPGRLEPVA